MTAPFPLFHLPLLVIDRILKPATPYELFSLSILSNRSSRIIKLITCNRKFALNLYLNVHNERHELLFYDGKRALRMKCYAGKVSGLWRFEYQEGSDEDSVLALTRNRNQGIQFMIHHFSRVFNIKSLNFEYKKCSKEFLTDTNTFVRSLGLKINNYLDLANEYSYKEVQRFKHVRHMLIKYPDITEKQYATIFKSWLEGSGPRSVHFKGPPRNVNLHYLIRYFGEKLRIKWILHWSCFEVTREDGLVGRATASKNTISLKICPSG